MYLRVARLAQRHQVAEIITAAARHGNYVVYLLNRSEPTLFQTHLAQWVSRCITLSYLPPRSAVFLVAVGRTDELVIAAVHLLEVFLAVLSVTTVGAAGVGTRALWPSGHGGHLLKSNDLFFFYSKIVRYYLEFSYRHTRSPAGSLTDKAFSVFFADYIIPQIGYCKIVDFTVKFPEQSPHAAPCGAFCRCYLCRIPSERLSAPRS